MCSCPQSSRGPKDFPEKPTPARAVRFQGLSPRNQGRAQCAKVAAIRRNPRLDSRRGRPPDASPSRASPPCGPSTTPVEGYASPEDYVERARAAAPASRRGRDTTRQLPLEDDRAVDPSVGVVGAVFSTRSGWIGCSRE